MLIGATYASGTTVALFYALDGVSEAGPHHQDRFHALILGVATFGTLGALVAGFVRPSSWPLFAGGILGAIAFGIAGVVATFHPKGLVYAPLGVPFGAALVFVRQDRVSAGTRTRADTAGVRADDGRQMAAVVETSWWLDWSGLPERLLWARLTLFGDGSAEVLDLDGNYHRFGDRQEAEFWLQEDEYSQLADLVEAGEVGVEVSPPRAENDRDLVPLMLVPRDPDA
jgi:hypothetical protein